MKEPPQACAVTSPQSLCRCSEPSQHSTRSKTSKKPHNVSHCSLQLPLDQNNGLVVVPRSWDISAVCEQGGELGEALLGAENLSFSLLPSIKQGPSLSSSPWQGGMRIQLPGLMCPF